MKKDIFRIAFIGQRTLESGDYIRMNEKEKWTKIKSVGWDYQNGESIELENGKQLFQAQSIQVLCFSKCPACLTEAQFGKQNFIILKKEINDAVCNKHKTFLCASCQKIELQFPHKICSNCSTSGKEY